MVFNQKYSIFIRSHSTCVSASRSSHRGGAARSPRQAAPVLQPPKRDELVILTKASTKPTQPISLLGRRASFSAAVPIGSLYPLHHDQSPAAAPGGSTGGWLPLPEPREPACPRVTLAVVTSLIPQHAWLSIPHPLATASYSRKERTSFCLTFHIAFNSSNVIA